MYPATFNFMDDADGSEPDGWTTSNGAGCTTTIIASLDGHKKVLRLYDPNGATRAEIYISVTQGLNTTIEFWVRWDVNESFFFDFYEGATVLGAIACNNNRIYWYNVGWTELKVGAVNTWYHVKVIFDDTANTVDCYIDGALAAGGSEAYENNSTSGVDKINLQTSAGDSGYNFYIDAIGVSTDANYNEGDNCFWRHYGESTDSFEQDDVGTQGTSITFIDSVLTASATTIENNFDEHKKFLRQVESAGNDWSYHNCTTQSKTGWYEFWLRCSDTTGFSLIQLNETGNGIITLLVDGGNITYWDGDLGSYEIGAAATNNVWYHIYIQWYDAATDTFDLWINNILVAEGIQCNANQVSGINRFYIVQYDAGDTLDIDAPTSSLDGDERGDNRLFDYNDSYTREDITSLVKNVLQSNLIFDWRRGTLYSETLYDPAEIFFQIYDINSKLGMEADIWTKRQIRGLYLYELLDKNLDDLANLSSNTFSSAKIHDPTDSGSILKTLLPNVSEADGDLILVNADAKTDTYSPVTKNYPDGDALRDVSDLANSVVIIEANGKCHLDDDLASGDSLDIDNESDKDQMTKIPIPKDITGINYWEVFGVINPDIGTRFYKITDNSGTDKKRKWRITNNSFITQTDVNNYAAKLVSKVIAVKEITISIQGFGAHNMGETFDYKYVNAVYNIPQANYYIISENINYDKAQSTLVLSEGLLEISKYASSYERPQNYSDSDIHQLIESNINSIDLTLENWGGATMSGKSVNLGAVGEVAKTWFYISDNVNADKDITLTWVSRRVVGVDTIDMEVDVGKVYTDGITSDAWIEQNTATEFPVCSVNEAVKLEWTVDSSDYTNGNLIWVSLELREAAKEMYIMSASAEFYMKMKVG